MVQVSARLAALSSQPVVQVASSIKMPHPSPFKGEQDGDTVETFVEAIDDYLAFVNMPNP